MSSKEQKHRFIFNQGVQGSMGWGFVILLSSAANNFVPACAEIHEFGHETSPETGQEVFNFFAPSVC